MERMKPSETFQTTLQFKNIFPTIEDFTEMEEYYILTPIQYGEDVTRTLLYRALYNKYCNCNIAYDTIDAFCRHFFVTYWDSVEEYSVVLSMIKRIRALSVDDILSGNMSVMNKSINDNAETQNPLSDIIPFISSQMTSRQYMNKTVAFYSALTSYKNNKMYEFLEKFRDHFINIFEKEYDVYRRN